MTPRRTLSVASLLLMGVAAVAQGWEGSEAAAEALSLTKAIEIGLAESPRLDDAGARTGIAAADLAERRALRRPSLFLSGEASRTNNPTLVFSNKLGQQRFAAEDFRLDSLNRPDPLSNYRTRLGVEAPLYGFGRLRLGLEAARLGLASAEHRQEGVRQAVAHEVASAYVDAVSAERRLAATRAVADTVALHLRLTRDLFEAGLVVESDVLQVEVRASEVAEMLARADSGVAIARATLNHAMGVPQSTRWRLETLGECAGAEERPLDDLVREARLARPDLAALDSAVEAARSTSAAERAGFWPMLSGGGFVETNSADPGSVDGDNWGLELGLRWVLFGGAEARARRAEQELLSIEQQQRIAAEGAELEVRRWYYELRDSEKRCALAGDAVGLAERALEIVEDRYREGLATAVELAEAESALAEARARQVAAAGDRVQARSALDFALGRL